MSDDAFYRPNRPPAPPRQPTPSESIWTIRVDHVTWSCEFRFHGESYGWEAQLLREGELVIGHRFILRRLAEAWAETERQILEKEGALTAYEPSPCSSRPKTQADPAGTSTNERRLQKKSALFRPLLSA